MRERKRRVIAIVFFLLMIVAGYAYESISVQSPEKNQTPVLGIADQQSVDTAFAKDVLTQLEVKGRAPKTGYKRSQFGQGWASAGMCDVRNIILARDLTEVVRRSESDCTVLSGKLADPYTGKMISFVRGEQTSDDVQIDHVVALSDAWQKGAQNLSFETREAFANDTLNLLAVDGDANSNKSDSDAASWLPPNKSYRCRYVARQVAVKQKYRLWITEAEKDAVKRILDTCPDQRLPVVRQNSP